MEKPLLIIREGEEFEVTAEVTSLGRTHDNDVSFVDDTNVSRFHAEIEERNGEFWLIDLNSSNGTTLNGEKVEGETALANDDVILLGGSSEITFLTEERVEEDEQEEEGDDDAESQPETASPSGDAEAVADESSGRRFTFLLIFAAIAIGLAITLVVAALIFFFSGGTISSSGGGGGGGWFSSGCEATAEIISPENGDILSDVSDVEVELTKGGCVKEVVFYVGGKEFGRATDPPYRAKLIPSKFPTLSDGRDHFLTVSLLDQEGEVIPKSPEIAISLETIETEEPDPTPVATGPAGDPTNPPPQTDKPQTVSLIDTQQMTKKVIPQFTGNLSYNTNNQQFLDAVARMIPEYTTPGYFSKAAKYRDVINYQFLREQNLDPQIGFLLAMSRTKFEPTNRADGAGLWKMDNQLVKDNNYNGICGNETIASESQKCAAIASSSYLKDLILNVFNGDIVYGIAAFGMDKQDAALWNSTLPTNPRTRADFWNVIKDPKRKEQVVRFFAAAVVTENPKKFNLMEDRPISELYPALAE